MKVFDSLKNEHNFSSPVVLTIGFFDGVHQGHTKIFNKMLHLLGDQGTRVVISFKNHPSCITKPQTPTPCIFPSHQKVKLLEKEGIDVLFLLEFTEELREQSADDFVALLMEKCPFDHLVLGPDASIGRDRKGNTERLALLAKKYGFTFDTVDFDRFQGQVISSTLIRDLIQKGELKLAEAYLNKKYSLVLDITQGEQQGRTLGFPTLNFEIEGLVHPPLGVYSVLARINEKWIRGVANLGFAPTLKELNNPVLEIHLLEPFEEQNLKTVEISFQAYIRPEKKFHSTEELKAQIQKDIAFVTEGSA